MKTHIAIWGGVLIFNFLLSFNLKAQHLDEIRFGNSGSELSHGLTSFNMSNSEVYTGQFGQKARRFLPDDSNPFGGTYRGTYGGEVIFVMKVDSTNQNYFTAKFSGDETYTGRILLVVDGKEVGGRHTGNEEYFESLTGPVSPGAFYYRTAPIPRTLTDGKTEVAIRLRSTGRYYYYGKPRDYATYQRVLTEPTRGIYAAFVHIDPGFSLDPAEIEGTTPSYATAPPKLSLSLDSLYINQTNALNNKITSLLNGGNTVSQNAAWNSIEFLAFCYERPEITVAYHNRALVDKICSVIDQFVRSDNNGTTKASKDWGGYYGRTGNGLALIGDHISDAFLDMVVDLGRGMVTRRSEWARIFKESFEFGATNRRTISNQEMFASLSVFGSALALKRLAPDAYPTYIGIGHHHVLESCGLEQFTGNAIISDGVATLGDPAKAFTGPNYYFTTLKGTTHEPGWVSPDCYGNLGNTLVEIYEMTKIYLGESGDKRILDVAVKHTIFQTNFTYAWNSQGKRAILAEGFDCVRNIYVPGKIFYGSPEVAGASGDKTLMGFIKQKFDDGQFEIIKDPKNTSSVYFLDALKNLMNNQYAARVPTSPDQPDFFAADEENGIVTIQNGREKLSMNMYYRTTGDNKLVRAHHITGKNERFLEFRPQYSEYRTNGKYDSRVRSVLSWSGEAPDAPESAYFGQKDYTSLGQRGILDLYQVRYNNYFIAMNTTRPGFDKTVKFPADMIGKKAYSLNAGNTITIPATMIIPSLTTFVFRIAGSEIAGGLIAGKTKKSNKAAILTKVKELEGFAQANSTVSKISVLPATGFYPYDTFNAFMRALSKAKYMANNRQVSQKQVDKALADLNKTYKELTINASDEKN